MYSTTSLQHSITSQMMTTLADSFRFDGAELTYVALYGLAHVTDEDAMLKAWGGGGMFMLCAPACLR